MPRRKKKQKVQSTTLFNEIDENIIICLPIFIEEISSEFPTTHEQSIYIYKPEIPTPVEDNSFSTINQFEWVNSSVGESKPKQEDHPSIHHKNNVVTDNRQVCMWCCHDFTTSIFNLPLMKNNSEYVVFGQFCSTECAASYNFHDIVEHGDPWERFSLLHSLYFDMLPQHVIQLAPPRIMLSMFGGKLSIDEFRTAHENNTNKTCKVSIAPIKHIKIFTNNSNLIPLKKKNKITQSSKLKHPYSFLTQCR